MGSDKDWLAEVKERAETATPGPWGIEECAGANLITTPGVMVAETVSDPDASFIAAARTDVLRLVAVVEAADALVGAYEAWVVACDDDDTDTKRKGRTIHAWQDMHRAHERYARARRGE